MTNLADTPPLRTANFRFLWLGLIFISSGVQFYVVVLTWLVLDLTGSSLQLGTVLAIGAIPRAIMMLLSGAIIDRSRPRRILLTASLMSGFVVGLIAVFLALDWLTIVYLCIAGVLLGLMDAFFYPTTNAMMFRMVRQSRLTQANALMQGADGIINMLAPAGSGLVVGAIGVGYALIVNSLLFLLGFCMIWGIRVHLLKQPEEPIIRENYFQSLMSGFRYALQVPAIRLSLLVIAALNFAAMGPTIIGCAILVEQRFGGDASMYGILLSAYGIGGLVGSLIATQMGHINRPGRMLIWVAVVIGISLIGTGLSQTFWVAFLIQSLSGIVIGLAVPFFIGWLQGDTSIEMQGRMSSLIAFSAVAVDPFSQSMAGFLSQIDLTLMFIVAGMLMFATAVIVSLNPVVHTVVEKTSYNNET